MYQFISVFHYTEITDGSLKQNVNIQRIYIRAFLTKKILAFFSLKIKSYQSKHIKNKNKNKTKQIKTKKENKTNKHNKKPRNFPQKYK